MVEISDGIFGAFAESMRLPKRVWQKVPGNSARASYNLSNGQSCCALQHMRERFGQLATWLARLKVLSSHAMSEYISLDPEYGLDPDLVILHTNLELAPYGPERYANRAEGEEGSPLAQFLFQIEGLAALEIDGKRLIVRREPEAEWHALLDEIAAALKEFFL
ncbi:MAG: hypothetical protein CUN49_10810 [Candidatus Thermofonsia Clade 1 bacterium]|uniref:Scaffold protein Nfu/NifU N-terminal domain-containing protein n=1 Tax=Candidatus Thermofonsia Clade 1 bacterium TaxID=2364210 RepID=A0A2M8PCW3_9CHLR|nr:MAG: hypothetical protein CUN49_10810 [Candidatus Thermofonsia Clade 1 bacterium]